MIERTFLRFPWSLLIFTLFLCGCVTAEAPAERAAAIENAIQQVSSPTTIYSPTPRSIRKDEVVVLSVTPGKEFEKELELTVNMEGEILVPLIGWIRVEGLTTKEAEEVIRERLDRDYLVDPKVSLRIKEAKTRAVVLLGQLKKPGTYEFPADGKMTLLEAVAKAEGFTDIANLKQVKVVRTLPDGSQKTIRLNVELILSGQDQDLELQEGDLITVPESFF